LLATRPLGVGMTSKTGLTGKTTGRLTGLLSVIVFCAGCETTSSILDGIIEGTRQGVTQGVGDSALEATADAMADATDVLCGNTGSAACRNLTSTLLVGFSAEFIKQMSQRDLKMIAAARDRSVQTGQIESWQNPQTGASGSVDSTLAAPKPPQPTPIKVQKNTVEALPVLDAVGEEYIVTANGGANMRSGPATTYKIVNKAAGGQTLMAIAKVQNQNWFLMGRDSIAAGYIFGDLVMPVAPDLSPATTPAATATAAVASLTAPPATEVEEVTASIAAECYTTTQSVTLGDGSSEEATITSCRTPNGWAQV